MGEDDQLAGCVPRDAKELIGSAERGANYHRITVQQQGGLIMPLHFEVTFSDGSKETVKLPADIWRSNEREFVYGFFSNKTVTEVVVDPAEAFADINRANNTWKSVPKPIS